MIVRHTKVVEDELFLMFKKKRAFGHICCICNLREEIRDGMAFSKKR